MCKIYLTSHPGLERSRVHSLPCLALHIHHIPDDRPIKPFVSGMLHDEQEPATVTSAAQVSDTWIRTLLLQRQVRQAPSQGSHRQQWTASSRRLRSRFSCSVAGEKSSQGAGRWRALSRAIMLTAAVIRKARDSSMLNVDPCSAHGLGCCNRCLEMVAGNVERRGQSRVTCCSALSRQH